jgi:hypothetical protein
MALSLPLLIWGGSEVAVVGEAIFGLLILCFLICGTCSLVVFLHVISGYRLERLRRRSDGKSGCLPWLPLLNLHLLFVGRREAGWIGTLLWVAGLHLLAAAIASAAAWACWSILSKWLQ